MRDPIGFQAQLDAALTRAGIEEEDTPMANPPQIAPMMPVWLQGMLAEQARVLQQINALTREAEERVAQQLDRLREDRARAFEESMRLIAELERFGLVDLSI
jgi:hypothetical protein